MKLLAFETATEACSVALWVDGEVRERFELAPRRHAELSLPWAEQLLAEAGIGKSQLDAIAVGRGPGAFTGVRLAIAIGQGIALALDRPIVPVSTLAALAMRAVAPSLAQGEGGDELLSRTASGSSCGEERSAGRGEEDRLQAIGLRPDERTAAMPTGRTGWGGVKRVLASIDARMNEVYIGRFALRDGESIALGDEAIAAPDAVALLDEGCDWFGVGTGFAALGGRLRQRLGDRLVAVDADALPHAADVARLAVTAFARGEALAPEFVEPAYLRNHVALTIAEQQALRDSRG